MESEPLSLSSSLPQSQLIQKYQNLLVKNGLGHKTIKNVVMFIPNLQGEGMSSVCVYVSLQLEEDDDDQEETIELFVKQMPTNSVHVKLLKQFDVFGKEAGFFNVLLKDLQEFYVEKSGKPMDFFPTCYYADENEIILDNLVKKKNGYYLYSKLDRKDLTKVLENLAVFHAISFSFVQTVGEEVALKKYGPYLREVFLSHDHPMFSGLFDNAKSVAVGLLNNNDVPGRGKALSSLRYRGENLLEKLLAAVSPESQIFCNVINHGGCWNSNMMFLKEPVSGKLKHQVFVDFQVRRYGSPNLDLSYFMFTSIQPPVRKQHWRNLLQIYFHKFTATIELLTKKPTPPWSFEQFLDDFKHKSIVGFWTNIFFTTAVEALSSLDSTKMEGDWGSFLNDGIRTWIRDNPDAAWIW